MVMPTFFLVILLLLTISDFLFLKCPQSLFVQSTRSNFRWHSGRESYDGNADSLPASVLFQMADISGAQSREVILRDEFKDRKAERSKEGTFVKMASRELELNRRKSGRSGEKKASPLITTTLATPTGWKWTTTTSEGMAELERKRSVEEPNFEEEEGERHKKHPSPVALPPKYGHPHHNVTTPLSSHHRNHKKTGAQVQQQSKRRNGGGRVTNWQDLSSTEQSIAMMLRCQDLETRELLPSAATCRNLRSDKVCNYLFQEIGKKTGRRDVKCNLQGLEDIAESCRKTCGICCEDINYACEDDKNGIIDCTRQLDKCHQKKWFGVLSRFCAGSCGLCAMTNCRDFDNSCRVRKALCLRPDSLDYMRENCARTCGFCVVGEDPSPAPQGGKKAGEGEGKGQQGKGSTGNSGKPVVVERPEQKQPQHRLIPPECADTASNCSANAHLCSSPLYGEYMIKFCTKTCLKCGQPQSRTQGKQPGPPPTPIEVIIQPLPLANEKGERLRVARKCEDKDEKCPKWKVQGICNILTGNFTEEQRKLCPKTCEICK